MLGKSQAMSLTAFPSRLEACLISHPLVIIYGASGKINKQVPFHHRLLHAQGTNSWVGCGSWVHDGC